MTLADSLNSAVEASRKAATRAEAPLEAAYLAQLRNALREAVRRYRALAGMGLTAAADWTPPSVADVLQTQATTTRIRQAQRNMMARIAGTYSEIPGVSFDATSPMTQPILNGLGVRAADLSAALREPVAAAIAKGWAEGLSVPDTAKLIERSTRSQLGAKATMLARTDLIGMSNAAGQGVAVMLNDAAKEANEPPPIGTKTWLSSHDARVRDSHAGADGQQVPLVQPYSVGGEALMYPGDPSGSNAETINCRCTELYDEPPPKKPTPKEEAVMEDRSPFLNDLLGAHADTRDKFSTGGIYTPERNRLHQKIIREFLKEGQRVPGKEKPTATFLSGGSGAGKSTVKKVLQDQGRFPKHAVDIDPDAIKDMLPEYQQALASGEKLGALIAHEESSDIAKMVLKEAQYRRTNIVIDGTGDSEPGKFLGKLTDQEALGYDVDVVMVDIPTDLAVKRATERYERGVASGKGGRYVPEKVIRQIHGDVAARFEEWRESPSVRSWQMWANENRPPTLFAERENGVTRIIDRKLYDAFLKKGGLKPEPSAQTAVAGELEWGYGGPENRSAGDPVRRGRLGLPGGAGSVRVGGGAAGVPGGEGNGPGVPEAEAAGTQTQGRVDAAEGSAGVPVAFQDDHDREDDTMSATETEVAVVTTGAAWKSDLAYEGMSTGDGRYIAEGALTWRDLPLTLMAMVETTQGGHLGAQVSGRIDAVEKMGVNISGEKLPDGVLSMQATGVFSGGEYGDEIERLVTEKILTGVSIDMSINEWQFRDPETGEMIDPEAASEADWERAFLGELEMAIIDGEIMAATVCPTPAFADAKIALLASAQTFSNTWKANDLAARRYRVPEGQLMTSMFAPLTVEDASLVAAPVFPVAPPREFFFTPEADHAMPLTFTDDGRVFGHIAPWSSCHTGFINGSWSQCVTPPRTRTNYKHFHVAPIPTAEGEKILIGKHMLGEAHAPGTGSRNAARAFYDRTGTIGCYLRAHDGKHGIWVSGAIKDDLTDQQWRDLNANPPSGDWRQVDGNLELIATIAVPVPGFPVPHSQVSLAASADGKTMHVSSLIMTAGFDDVGFGAAADVLAAEIEGGPDGIAALIAGE